MKKRILSILLATALILAMAIPVSAANTLVSEDITYDGCRFGIYSRLDAYGFHNLIEAYFFPSDKNAADYSLKTGCDYHLLDNDGLIVHGSLIFSPASIMVSSLRKTYDLRVYSTKNYFLINNASVYPAFTLRNY